MAKFGEQALWQAISCLLCIVVAWVHLDDLGASEFSGGWLMGPLFTIADDGSILFILAIALAFLYRRIAAVIAFVASIFYLPFYLYFIAPGPFRWVFKGEYSVPLRANFVWNNWAIAGIASLIVAVFVCLRSFSSFDTKIELMPENRDSH